MSNPALSSNQFTVPKEANINWDTEAIMASGGKNKSSAVPVEAEGGEVKVKFDDNYNILSQEPIIGASHAEGGVDTKLPKNHAILNKAQLARLNSGESLKSIIESLPDVKNVEKAQNSAVNHKDPKDLLFGYTPPDNTTTPQTTPPDWKLWENISNAYVSPIPYQNMGDDESSVDRLSKEMQRWGYGHKPNESQGLPSAQDQTDLEQSLINNKFVPNAKNPDFSVTQKPEEPKGETIPTGLDMSPISLEPMKEWEKNAALNNMPGGKPSLVDSGFKPTDKTIPPPKFGYPEEKAIGDAFANILALTQPKPTGVTVQPTHVGTPSMVTPRFMNPKATLESVGKQINAGVRSLVQTGRSDMIPSLISVGVQSANEVGEKFATANLQAETQALATNAGESNRFSLTQSGIDSDNAKTNAMLELKRLEVEGAQNSERYRALSNLVYGVSDYQKSKMDQQMRDAVRARILTSQYMGT